MSFSSVVLDTPNRDGKREFKHKIMILRTYDALIDKLPDQPAIFDDRESLQTDIINTVLPTKASTEI